MLSSKPKRPISLLDVIFGSIGFPLLAIGIFYGLDIWLLSPTLLSYPLNLSGVVFVILGVSLASWCFTIAFALPKKPMLVTWGPWAHIRHPIYLAGILVNLGVAMMIGTALLALEFIGYTLFETLFDTPREERNLRKNFPDEYAVYSKRVPGWIPRIREWHLGYTKYFARANGVNSTFPGLGYVIQRGEGWQLQPIETTG